MQPNGCAKSIDFIFNLSLFPLNLLQKIGMYYSMNDTFLSRIMNLFTVLLWSSQI